MDISSATLAPQTAGATSAAAHPPGCTCSQCSNKHVARTAGSDAAAAKTGDTVELSPAAHAAGDGHAASSASDKTAAKTPQGDPLSKDQEREVAELKKRDADVRQHEAAHLAAAGGTARSGAILDYQTGPDGRKYAVGGHVDIDTGVVSGNPSATLAKMEQVQRAALAPADPSGQDRAVAAQAAAQAQKARAELAQQHQTTAGSTTSKSAAATQSKPTSSSKKQTPQPSTTADSAGRLLDVTA